MFMNAWLKWTNKSSASSSSELPVDISTGDSKSGSAKTLNDRFQNQNDLISWIFFSFSWKVNNDQNWSFITKAKGSGAVR